MRQKVSDIDFDQVEAFDSYRFDPSYANTTENASKWVKTFHNQSWDTPESFERCIDDYRALINTSIKTNNLETLTVLWDGPYMGRDNPDFEENIKVATEFGNLTTFLHILYAYCNSMTLNPLDPLEYDVLIDLSSKNDDVRVAKFIESIEEFFENKEFYPRCEEICDTTDDESSKEYKRKFYKHVKEFAKVSQ